MNDDRIAIKREQFEQWLKRMPEARFWNTTDAMFAAWQAAQAQPVLVEQLTVRIVSFPESNGKRNWTAMFVRTKPWGGLVGNAGGITIARGEFWNRVAYEAERARCLLGERATEPSILAYGKSVSTPDEWTGSDPDGLANKRPVNAHASRVDCGACPMVTSGCERGHCMKASGA